MIQAYKTSYALELDLKADKASATLDRINKSIKSMEKIIDKHLKGVNNLYSKQTKMLNKQIELEKKKLSVLKQQKATKEKQTKGSLSDKELRLLEKQLKVQKAISIEKTKAAKKALTEANRVELVNLKSDKRILEKNISTKAKKDLIELKQSMVEANKSATGLIHNMSRAVTTVPAFYAVYTAMNAVTSSFQATIDYAIQFDNTMRTLSAVTGETVNVTSKLSEEVFKLGNIYGGSLEDFATTAQELSRAGIDTKELVKATEVTAQLALITGDTIQSASNAVISYSQVYQKSGDKMVYTTEQLGDKLAYMANASRLSTQDIGTLSNYALASAKSVGLTIDQVNALAISFSNAGNNASTIGTQIRRFTNTLHSNSTAVKEFYKSINVNRTELLTNLGSSKDGTTEGIKKSNQAFEDFVKKVQSLSENEYKNAIYGMNVLDNQFFNQLRNNGEEAIGYMKTSFNDLSGELQKTGTIADGLGKRWERMWNRFVTGAKNSEAIDAVTTASEDAFNLISLGAEQHDNYNAKINGTISDSTKKLLDKTVYRIKEEQDKLQVLQRQLVKTTDEDESKALSAFLAQLTKRIELEKTILDLRQSGSTIPEKVREEYAKTNILLSGTEAIFAKLKDGGASRFLEAEKLRLELDKELKVHDSIAKAERKKLINAKALEKVEKARLALAKVNDKLNSSKHTNNIETQALEAEKKRLEGILTTNAEILRLGKEQVSNLGVTNTEVDKYIEKLTAVKSLTDDQVRAFGSYAKAIGGTTGGLDSSLVKDFIANTDAALKRQAQSSLQYRNQLLKEELKAIGNLSDKEIESIKQVDLARGKSTGAIINKLTEERKFVEANAKAYGYKQNILNQINKLKSEEIGLDKESVDLIEAKIAKLEATSVSLQNIIDTNAKGIQIQNTSKEAQDKITRAAEGTNRTLIQTITLAGQLESSLLSAANALGVTLSQASVLAGRISQEQHNIETKSKAVVLANKKEIESLKVVKALQDSYRDSGNEKTRIALVKATVDWENKHNDTLKAKNAVIVERNSQTAKTIKLTHEKTRLELQQDFLTKQNSKSEVSRIANAKQLLKLKKDELAEAKELFKRGNVKRNDNSVLKAQIAVQQAEQALLKASESYKKKASTSASKAHRKAIKELREYGREAKRKLSILHELAKQQLLIAQIENGGKPLSDGQKKSLELGILKQELKLQTDIFIEAQKLAKENVKSVKAKELANKEYTKQLEIAKKIVDIEASLSFEDMLKDVFNVKKGGWADTFINDFGKQIETALKGIASSVFEGARNGKGINESLAGLDLGVQGAKALQDNPSTAVFGYALEAIGALFSSTVSQAEIDAATGRSDFSDESIAKMGDTFANALNPQLKATNTMSKYLRSMNTNFGAVARAITGKVGSNTLDLTGTNYNPKERFGTLGFNSKSVSLLGTGLDLSGALGSVDVQGYVSELIKKSSWWGLSKSTKTKTKNIDLPKNVTDSIQSAFTDGMASIITAGASLGFNETELNNQLKDYKIKIGKINLKGLTDKEVQEKLSNVFSEVFSGAIGSLDGINDLVKKYAKTGEENLGTLSRIATEYEQAGYAMRNIGHVWTDSVNNVLDVVDNLGGLQQFNDAYTSYIENFYTSQEQFNLKLKNVQYTFDQLGVTMPKTNEAFRELVDSANAAGDTELYSSLLQVNAQFYDMTSSLESASSGLSAFKKNVSDTYRKLTEFKVKDIVNNLDYYIKNKDYSGAQSAVDRLNQNALDRSATREDYIRTIGDINNRVQNIKPENPYKKMEDNQERLIKSIDKLQKTVDNQNNDDIVSSVNEVTIAIDELNKTTEDGIKIGA